MNIIIIILLMILGFLVLTNGWKIFQASRRNSISLVEAGQEHFKDQLTPTPRVDKKASEEWSPKSLGGQPLYYNDVDHSYGRFVGLVRTETDRADPRIIHNNCFRVRYLKDVKYFWGIKASKEYTTPCVFRPGIDIHNKSPGEEDGVPSEGLVIIKRSMDGQRLARGEGERYRSLLLQEKGYNRMLSDMLLTVQQKNKLAHMDPTSKEYVDAMVQMLQRTKKIQDAAGGRSGGNDFGLANPYSQEMYGAEDNTPSAGGDEGLWRLG